MGHILGQLSYLFQLLKKCYCRKFHIFKYENFTEFSKIGIGTDLKLLFPPFFYFTRQTMFTGRNILEKYVNEQIPCNLTTKDNLLTILYKEKRDVSIYFRHTHTQFCCEFPTIIYSFSLVQVNTINCNNDLTLYIDMF